jgi:hypothetical protein
MDLFDIISGALLFGVVVFLAYYLLRSSDLIKGREDSVLEKLYRAFTKAIDDLFDPLWDFLGRWWRQHHEYTESNPKYWFRHFIITRAFTAESYAGFKIQYELDLICRRKDDEVYKAARMLDDSVRQQVAEAYHKEVFCRHFDENRYFFHFGWDYTPEWPEHEIVRTPVSKLVETSGIVLAGEVLQTRLNVDLHPLLFEKNGCELQLGKFRNHIFPDHLIEENYAMISKEELEEVEDDERYGELIERIAVVALKRRLEFFGKQSSQKHETDKYSITTEKSGRVVRIRWSMKSTLPSDELVGFRKTGGFHPEILDETKHGTLIAHSSKDGEVIETLSDKESYFYTFFLQSAPERDGKRVMDSPLRFQLATASAEETKAIQSTLALIETRKPPPDPDKEHISRAIKELGVFVELDAALEAKTREWKKGIMENEEYSAEEKADKIERLRDVMAALRSKYEP